MQFVGPAGGGLAGEAGELGFERAGIGGARLAALSVGGEIGVAIEHVGELAADHLQHRDHHQVAGAEFAFEPLGIAEPLRELAEPLVDPLADRGLARLGPGLVRLEQRRHRPVAQVRFDRVERGEDPFGGACPAVRPPGQQPRRAVGHMEHDRARFEQRQFAFLKGRHLPERLARAVRGLLLGALGQVLDAVVEPDFLERPAHPQVADQAARETGHPVVGGDRDRGVCNFGHGQSFPPTNGKTERSAGFLSHSPPQTISPR